MTIQGTITHVLPTRSGSGTKGDWTVYSYVLQTDGQYPKSISFEVFNTDHNLMEGDVITAHINIESREHNGKWYTAIKAYKVEGGQSTANRDSARPTGNTGASARPASEDSEDDDLPF